MKKKLLGILLGLVFFAVHAFAQSESNDLSTVGSGNSTIIKYRVSETLALNQDEWPGLVVFVSRANGPILSERIVLAKDMRSGVDKDMVITAQHLLFFAPIASEGGSERAGYRINIYDTKAEKIKNGAILEMPFDDLKSLSLSQQPGTKYTPGSGFDLVWLGNEFKISAALVAFKTEKGAFVFKRFLSKVHTVAAKAPA